MYYASTWGGMCHVLSRDRQGHNYADFYLNKKYTNYFSFKGYFTTYSDIIKKRSAIA